LLLFRVLWKDDREARAIVRSKEQTVEPILDVELGKVDGAILGIRVANAAEDSLERTTELHGLGRCVRQSFLVNRIPRRMVTQNSGLAFPLFLDGGRQQHKRGEREHLAIGKDCPESILDELGHFLSDELVVLDSGLMEPTLDAQIFGLGRPGKIGCQDWDPVVSPKT